MADYRRAFMLSGSWLFAVNQMEDGARMARNRTRVTFRKAPPDFEE